MSEGKLERFDVDIGLVHPNPLNPNEMSDAEFNLLCDNVERVGLTDPILVWPHPEKPGCYQVVGGHHRLEVAKMFGYEKVPVTVITDPNFTGDDAAFQAVRHNIIHGKMSPMKFMKLYQSLSGEYSEQAAAEMFGFVDEDEFKKLIYSTASSLPPEMKEKFQEASKEIKTIDDLAKVLNKLFSEHGDTLPYGYMVFDYGGKDNLWLRMYSNQKKDFEGIAKACMESGKSVSHVMTLVLKELSGAGAHVLETAIANADEVSVVQDQLEYKATLDNAL